MKMTFKITTDTRVAKKEKDKKQMLEDFKNMLMGIGYDTSEYSIEIVKIEGPQK